MVFFAGAFLAGAFFAGAAFVAVVFFAGAFLAGVAFVVDAFFAGAAFVVEAFFAGAFVAGVFFAGAFFAGAFLPPGAAFFTESASSAAIPIVSAGSSLAPETTFLRSLPGLNSGTADVADWIRFWNDPKPVIATFSPLAISRVMVSSTDSSACAAALRFPSKRAESASMSCVLFTAVSLRGPSGRRTGSPCVDRTLGTPGPSHNDRHRWVVVLWRRAESVEPRINLADPGLHTLRDALRAGDVRWVRGSPA